MDAKEIDLKKLGEANKERLDKALEHIKSKGNFSPSAEEETELIRNLKLSPHICPCKICECAKDRSKIESFSFPLLVTFKVPNFGKDNLTFIIAPFRHMSNEEFALSPLFGMIGRMFGIMKKILSVEYGHIMRFKLMMDNTYGDAQQEIGEHGHVSVTFFKEEKG